MQIFLAWQQESPALEKKDGARAERTACASSPFVCVSCENADVLFGCVKCYVAKRLYSVSLLSILLPAAPFLPSAAFRSADTLLTEFCYYFNLTKCPSCCSVSTLRVFSLGGLIPKFANMHKYTENVLFHVCILKQKYVSIKKAMISTNLIYDIFFFLSTFV